MSKPASKVVYDGVDRITTEREKLKAYTGIYDSSEGQLALAAVCYASPVPLYVEERSGSRVSFVDPWPYPLPSDKRPRALGDHVLIRDPRKLTPMQRIAMLEKAGAFLAAEIDRLLDLIQQQSKDRDGPAK